MGVLITSSNVALSYRAWGCESELTPVVNRLSAILQQDRFAVTADRIVIPPRSSGEFQIAASFYDNKWIVSFDNWYDDFEDIESVFQLISQALAGRLRLRIDRIGGRPIRWTVEGRNNGSAWVEIYSNGLFTFTLVGKWIVYIGVLVGRRSHKALEQNRQVSECVVVEFG